MTHNGQAPSPNGSGVVNVQVGPVGGNGQLTDYFLVDYLTSYGTE